jgi:hypothetical protein
MNKMTDYNIPIDDYSLHAGKGMLMVSSTYNDLKTHEVVTCRANNWLILIGFTEQAQPTRLSVVQRRTIKPRRFLLSP